ncbi:OstA family protein [Euhalothece natronophila Z-M001]|uniref:OstA family protein n=1 Tax=Euhalothece natronophila Z-M001 TaxID=522448 RepID=A0A5B8NKE6_9CHRO|nr:LptA/OstA family protein [Euhalothece natronophila]QDZ38991.1 OstA family protein [Euhalothece natronophila Z-M001]
MLKANVLPLKYGLLAVTLFSVVILPNHRSIAQSANGNGNNRMTVTSDIQEANSETGVISARGNVRINYPVQELEATSAQAQYFQGERRLVLTGDVDVMQAGNNIQAERVTYFMEEGRFVATPKEQEQVRSTFVIPEGNNNGENGEPDLNLPGME